MKAATTTPVLVALLIMACGTTWGHGMATPVLALSEIEPGEFSVRWERAPGFDSAADAFRRLDPLFPSGCVLRPPQLHCGNAGLTGQVTLAGLGLEHSVAILRLAWHDGSRATFTLTSGTPSVRLVGGGAGLQGRLLLARTYLGIGIEHILLGVDHLLFVLGLIWLVPSTRVLIWTITAFTLAHSLTLAAATLQVLAVPEPPLNAVIALSIAIVAVEVLRVRRGTVPWSARWPWLVAFAFGLLHGLGFAGALRELGLPRTDLPWALMFFNLGVEVGQVVFVLLILAFRRALRVLTMPTPRWTETGAIYAVGTIAMVWFYQRLAAIWPNA